MAKRIRQVSESEEVNIWSAFTDLMSNAFMIILLLLFMVIATTQTRIFELSKTESQGIPPFIEIKDNPDFRFPPSSAKIASRMEQYIKNQIVPLIDENTKKYGINIVEIIGHTDEQPLGVATSNLDQNLEIAANSISSTNIDSLLKAGSNVDLGLMRSLAVVKLLQEIQQQENKMAKVKFRPYSAAQLILPDGDLADPPRQNNRQSDAKRRRIEIRFTRLGEAIKPK